MQARFLAVLTVINLALLATNLVQTAHARRDSILRGTGLEIVDEQGRLRAQLKLEPGDPDYVWPDGHKGYGETVIFRLVTADGKPRVKLTTSDDGSGLMLLGSTDTTHTILHADGSETSLLLRNDEQVQQVLHP